MDEMESHFPWLAPFTMELRRLSFNLDQDHYYRLIHKFEGLISVEATKLRRKPNRASKLVANLRRLISHLKLVGVSMCLDGRGERASLRGLGLVLTHHIALITASSMKERRSPEVVGGETYLFVKSMLDGVGTESLVLDTILASTTTDNYHPESIGHALLLKVVQDGSSYWGDSATLLKFLVVLRLLQDEDPNTKDIVSKAIIAIPRIPCDFEAFVEQMAGIKQSSDGDRDLVDLVAILKPSQLIQMSRKELRLPETSEGVAVDSDDPSDGEELKILLDTQGDQSWAGINLNEVETEPKYWRSLGSLEESESEPDNGSGDEAKMGSPTKYSTRSPSPHSPSSANENDMYQDVLGESEEEKEELTMSGSVLPAAAAAIDDFCIPPLEAMTQLRKMSERDDVLLIEEEEESMSEEESEAEAESDSSIEEVFADMAVKKEIGEESEDERDEASADSDSDHYYYPKIKARARQAVSSSSEEEEEPSTPKKPRISPPNLISQPKTKEADEPSQLSPVTITIEPEGEIQERKEGGAKAGTTTTLDESESKIEEGGAKAGAATILDESDSKIEEDGAEAGAATILDESDSKIEEGGAKPVTASPVTKELVIRLTRQELDKPITTTATEPPILIELPQPPCTSASDQDESHGVDNRVETEGKEEDDKKTNQGDAEAPVTTLAPHVQRGGRRGRGGRGRAVVIVEGRTTRSKAKVQLEPVPAEAAPPKRGQGRGRGRTPTTTTTHTLRSRR